MGLLGQLSEHRASLLRGVTLLLGGATLVLVGTLIGAGEEKWQMLTAGTLGVAGVTVMFLGFFVYVLPPMLPPK